MIMGDLTATTDDNPLDNEQADLEYRKSQLVRLQSEIVDLEDLREGVSITDLGLTDFRIDLSNYLKTYGQITNIPEGLHAVVASNHLLKPGVVFVLKNVNPDVNIDKINRLHPYYLIYIDMNGNVQLNHVEAKKVLDALRMLCKGRAEPIADLCHAVSNETDEYHKMDKYSTLLRQSISTILKTEEEKDVKSLLKSGGTTALKDRIKGLEDFKLVSFLIVR